MLLRVTSLENYTLLHCCTGDWLIEAIRYCQAMSKSDPDKATLWVSARRIQQAALGAPFLPGSQFYLQIHLVG